MIGGITILHFITTNLQYYNYYINDVIIVESYVIVDVLYNAIVITNDVIELIL